MSASNPSTSAGNPTWCDAQSPHPAGGSSTSAPSERRNRASAGDVRNDDVDLIELEAAHQRNVYRRDPVRAGAPRARHRHTPPDFTDDPPRVFIVIPSPTRYVHVALRPIARDGATILTHSSTANSCRPVRWRTRTIHAQPSRLCVPARLADAADVRSRPAVVGRGRRGGTGARHHAVMLGALASIGIAQGGRVTTGGQHASSGMNRRTLPVAGLRSIEFTRSSSTVAWSRPAERSASRTPAAVAAVSSWSVATTWRVIPVEVWWTWYSSTSGCWSRELPTTSG